MASQKPTVSLNPFDDDTDSLLQEERTVVTKSKNGSRHEPVPKFGHQSTVVNDKLYLWGGWQKGFPAVHTSEEKTCLTSFVDVLNLHKGEWEQVELHGSPPLGVRGYACATIGSCVYYFGGYCGHDWCRHCTIKCLETASLEWKDVPCTNPQRSPMKKNACGMVAFKDGGDDYLFIFGGAGMMCSANEPEAIYIPWKENPDYGWTNEMHVFSLKTGDWITPKVTGERPPPCAGFSLTQISENSALLYGGLNPDNGECIPDVYIVEMTRGSMKWQKIPVTEEGPRARHDHAAVCISGPLFGHTKPQVLIAGGRDVRWRSLDDVWLLDCSNGKWNQLEVPQSIAHRHYHSLSVYPVNEQCMYAIMYGGVTEWEKETSPDDQPMISDTSVLEIVEGPEGMWIVSAVLDSSILSSTEEYKCRLIQTLFQIIRTPDDQISASEQTIPNLQEQLRIKERENNDLKTRIRSLEHLLENAQKDLQERDRQRPPVPSQPPATDSTDSAVRPPRPPPSELSSAITRAINAENVALEVTEDALKPLLISGHDLAVSGAPFDMGIYGHTVRATFQGFPVSARVFKEPPSTEYSKLILQRELYKCMNIRHPNILQLLGAIMDVGVVIVNEFLPTTLHQELEKKALIRQEILNISRDVSSALKYLHDKKPHPLIHRSISTKYIYLDPLAFKFRAKLSDTLLGNYFHFATDDTNITDPAYCAPECPHPQSHTPKLDIYAFGIVVIEMISRKTPVVSASEREQVITGIKWPAMMELIRKCITEEARIRPSASNIIEELEKIQTK